MKDTPSEADTRSISKWIHNCGVDVLGKGSEYPVLDMQRLAKITLIALHGLLSACGDELSKQG